MQKIMDISKKQFSELKESCSKLLKNKTFYVYLLLAVLLVPALFFEGFIYPVIVVAVVASVFFNTDDTMALALFLYPFFSVFVINGTNFYFYLFAVITLVLGVKFVIDLVKKKQNLDWILLIFIAVYCLFLILPIRQSVTGTISNNCNITNIASVGVFFVFLYLVYKYRDRLNFIKILHVFVVGFLLSGAYGLFSFCSERLQGVMYLIYYHGFDLQRFNGLFVQPNTLAIISSVAFAIVLYLYYHKKLGLEAHAYLTLIFLLGYVTLARSFLYAIVICFVIYVIAEIVRDRKNSYKYILPFLIEFGIVMLVCFAHTKVHFQRAEVSDLLNGYESAKDAQNSSETFVDPGRGGLIKLYLKDFLSSTLVVLFGRGISHEWFGNFSSHNTYLQAFWNTGIVGVILLFAIFVLILRKFTGLNFKIFCKKTFTDFSLYFLLIPVLAIMFIENLFMNMQMIIVIMLIAFAILCVKQNRQNVVQEPIVDENEENKKI